ncbi:hypothetical protein DdX_16047 [Ditylenchus destructor]|uniref:Uncharacterized protein n=1 Tax=Ditylenchus destructor TaxID=166010 RepID=A0AAD4QX37_9BILA|nr:hypothetical protein DdX_16047 [Ditylenchus destructor]
MILCEYQPDVYQSLGDVEEVSKQVDNEMIKGLGDIVLMHNHGDDVNVMVAHRHFDLEENEAMLEEQVGEDRIAKPVPLKEIYKKGAYPDLFHCSKDGKWSPVGFGLDKDVNLAPWSDEAFLQEVGNYLILNGLNDKLLLATRASKDVKDQGVQLVEYNCEKTRTSKKVPCTREQFDASVPTTYAFKRNADGSVEEGCLHACFCKNE